MIFTTELAMKTWWPWWSEQEIIYKRLVSYMSSDFVRKTDGRHVLALYLYRKEPKSVGRNSNVHTFSRARHVCQNGDARDFLDVDLECLRSHLFCSINANFEWLPPDGLFFFFSFYVGVLAYSVVFVHFLQII